MQSKGIIKWLAVILGIASIFQLTFTFVTRGIEAEAKEQNDPQAYLDQKWDQKVCITFIPPLRSRPKFNSFSLHSP